MGNLSHFFIRVEKVLYEIQRRSPIMSDAEKQMHIQMRQFDAQLNKIRQNLEALRRREQHYSSKACLASVFFHIYAGWRQFEFFSLGTIYKTGFSNTSQRRSHRPLK